MGLYLGFSLLWIYSIVQPKFLQTALITNMFFMLGLALGRIISVFIDGIPTFGYQIGIVGELLLGFYSFWALRKIKW